MRNPTPIDWLACSAIDLKDEVIETSPSFISEARQRIANYDERKDEDVEALSQHIGTNGVWAGSLEVFMAAFRYGRVIVEYAP